MYFCPKKVCETALSVAFTIVWNTSKHSYEHEEISRTSRIIPFPLSRHLALAKALHPPSIMRTMSARLDGPFLSLSTLQKRKKHVVLHEQSGGGKMSARDKSLSRGLSLTRALAPPMIGAVAAALAIILPRRKRRPPLFIS